MSRRPTQQEKRVRTTPGQERLFALEAQLGPNGERSSGLASAIRKAKAVVRRQLALKQTANGSNYPGVSGASVIAASSAPKRRETQVAKAEWRMMGHVLESDLKYLQPGTKFAEVLVNGVVLYQLSTLGWNGTILISADHPSVKTRSDSPHKHNLGICLDGAGNISVLSSVQRKINQFIEGNWAGITGQIAEEKAAAKEGEKNSWKVLTKDTSPWTIELIPDGTKVAEFYGEDGTILAIIVKVIHDETTMLEVYAPEGLASGFHEDRASKKDYNRLTRHIESTISNSPAESWRYGGL